MKPAYPPIIKLAERIVLQLEITVRGFSRYHKYTLGTELRQQAHAHVPLGASVHGAIQSKQLEWLSSTGMGGGRAKAQHATGATIKGLCEFWPI
jgi:hypothetical protein